MKKPGPPARGGARPPPGVPWSAPGEPFLRAHLPPQKGAIRCHSILPNHRWYALSPVLKWSNPKRAGTNPKWILRTALLFFFV